MTHDEKITYMQVAASIVGYNFDLKGIDMLISIYDYILLRKGESDMQSIVKIQCAVEDRYIKRAKSVCNPSP